MRHLRVFTRKTAPKINGMPPLVTIYLDQGFSGGDFIVSFYDRHRGREVILDTLGWAGNKDDMRMTRDRAVELAKKALDLIARDVSPLCLIRK